MVGYLWISKTDVTFEKISFKITRFYKKKIYENFEIKKKNFVSEEWDFCGFSGSISTSTRFDCE